MQHANRLDAPSRGVLARFCFEIVWFGIIAFAPVALGVTTPVHALVTLGTYCAFAAFLRVFIAARRREKPFASSLNSWDECMALTSAAMLAYAVAHMLS